MRALSLLALASTLVAVPLLGPAGPAEAATTPGITVLSVTGSGCRPNTTTAALSVDRTAVTITYSDYIVAAAGSTRTVSRSCRILLNITPVRGYTPAITSVDYRGFADLAAGSVARLAATYQFHGVTRVRSTPLRLAGAFSDDWQATDGGDAGLVAGRCPGSHVLDAQTTLSLNSTPAGAATDLITLDSTDAVVPNTFHLAWRRCF
jgi:hypothetical protein